MMQLSDEELANIAHDYYLSKFNIADIAHKYNLSRYLVTKALNDAQEKNIVHISIKRGIKRADELERKFQHVFNLKEIVILKNLNSSNQDNAAIISFAAKQIQAYIKSAHIVGMTWGSLIRDVINNFIEVKKSNTTFVQLLGQPINSDQRKNPVVQLAASKYNGKILLLPAPLYVLKPQFLILIKNEPFFNSLEKSYQKLDLIFSSLGTLKSFSVNKYIEKNYKDKLFKNVEYKDIAGMILGRPYDINGNFLGNFENHICGISIHNIMKIPTRFVIVKNRFKTQALLGALRSGIITHLITNEDIANRVLEEAKEKK